MKRSEFDKLVEESFERLPEWVREKIKNVALLIEDEPSEEERKEQGLEDGETLLGLYKGIPLSERGEHYGIGPTLPDTITLYQNPIEQAAEENITTSNVVIGDNNDLRSRYGEEVRKVVAETIWHEYAHHFGIDEEDVQRRERNRDKAS